MKKYIYIFIMISFSIFNILGDDIEKKYKIKISVEGETLYGYLNSSVTSKSFIKKLPLTLPMLNLYSREIVNRLVFELPTDSLNYSGYKVGEIIYWPPRRSFVIMYKQNNEKFSMQKMGKIETDISFLKNIKDNTDFTIELVKEEK